MLGRKIGRCGPVTQRFDVHQQLRVLLGRDRRFAPYFNLVAMPITQPGYTQDFGITPSPTSSLWCVWQRLDDRGRESQIGLVARIVFTYFPLKGAILLRLPTPENANNLRLGSIFKLNEKN